MRLLKRVIGVVVVVMTVGTAGVAHARQRACCSPTVTVLAVMTPDAAGNVPDLATVIAGRVASASAALRNSGVDVRLALVHVAGVDFGGAVASDLLASARTDERVSALRDQYLADLVSVWAWDEMGRSVALLPSLDVAIPETGFHVIALRGTCDGCALTHEIGHNLGVRHEDGYCRTGDPAFRDLMTPCDGAPFVPPLVEMFSNPRVDYLGVPFGDAEHDAASRIRRAVGLVANYR